jgi:GT2 family glycosyltransferase
MQFSVIIPTYKRPDALAVTVDSVLSSSRLPTELLIIDDDETSSELLDSFTKEAKDKHVELRYFKKDHAKIRRGLSESKNWAASLAVNHIIFYLDDDVVLDSDYCAYIMNVWEENKEALLLMGVGGKISNNRPTSKWEKYYRKLFGLTGECDWDVNAVGFQVWDEGVSKVQKGYYLHGGVSSYRRTLILENPFATFSGGRTGLEDVEHCLRSKNAGFHFYYTPHAHLTHHPASAGREAVYEAAKKESVNRRAMWREQCNHGFSSRLHFALANVGWVGKKVLSKQWSSAKGLIIGLLT